MSTPEDNLKASPEDRLDVGTSRSGGFPYKALLIVLVIAVGLLLLFYPGDDEVPPEPVSPAPVVEAPPQPQPLPQAEDIPEREPPPEPEPVPEPEPEIVPAEPPLPAPEESDPLLREQILAAGATGLLAGFAEGENILQRLVALVDGSSRGVVLRKILPVKAPEKAFMVESRGDQMFMSQAGYARYDSYVDAVTALDTGFIVNSFHELRPLYETAYAQLGLAAEDLDNAVIRTLDRILSTPEIEEPIALERESVMYTYADPELEALPELQKQLLRMGPENIRRLKEHARALRAGLLSP